MERIKMFTLRAMNVLSREHLGDFYVFSGMPNSVQTFPERDIYKSVRIADLIRGTSTERKCVNGTRKV